MKLVSVATFVATVVTAAIANAEGIVCSHDMRPVDGIYKEIKLEKINASEYKLTHRIAGHFRGSGPFNNEYTLIEAIPCKTVPGEPFVYSCFKYAARPGEEFNSGVDFTKVLTTTVRGTFETIKISAFSNEITKLVSEKKLGEGRQEHEFKAAGCKQL